MKTESPSLQFILYNKADNNYPFLVDVWLSRDQICFINTQYFTEIKKLFEFC